MRACSIPSSSMSSAYRTAPVTRGSVTPELLEGTPHLDGDHPAAVLRRAARIRDGLDRLGVTSAHLGRIVADAELGEPLRPIGDRSHDDAKLAVPLRGGHAHAGTVLVRARAEL